MTAFLPNARVTLLRADGSVDDFGDTVDIDTAGPVYPAAITEGKGADSAGGGIDQRLFRPVEGRTTLVETYTIRLRPDAQVVEGDRLRDEQGRIYQVQHVIYPQRVVGIADVRVSAVRVGGASQPVNG